MIQNPCRTALASASNVKSSACPSAATLRKSVGELGRNFPRKILPVVVVLHRRLRIGVARVRLGRPHVAVARVQRRRDARACLRPWGRALTPAKSPRLWTTRQSPRPVRRRPGLKRDVFTNNASSPSAATLLRPASHRSMASSVGAGSVRGSFCALPLPSTHKRWPAWSTSSTSRPTTSPRRNPRSNINSDDGRVTRRLGRRLMSGRRQERARTGKTWTTRVPIGLRLEPADLRHPGGGADRAREPQGRTYRREPPVDRSGRQARLLHGRAPRQQVAAALPSPQADQDLQSLAWAPSALGSRKGGKVLGIGVERLGERPARNSL